MTPEPLPVTHAISFRAPPPSLGFSQAKISPKPAKNRSTELGLASAFCFLYSSLRLNRCLKPLAAPVLRETVSSTVARLVLAMEDNVETLSLVQMGQTSLLFGLRIGQASTYRVFGDSPSQRAAEDIAFAVAHFFARNGLKREPKFGHLRDLHRALRLSKKPLLWGNQSVQKINEDLEITTYEKAGTYICVAFLTNNNTREDATINFRGVDYFLPAKSISILPNCKTVVYNTQTFKKFRSLKESKDHKMGDVQEMVCGPNDLEIETKSPNELYMFTKDTSDYAWYSTRINLEKRDLPMRPDICPVFQIASLGHALAAFVNGEYVDVIR
ncbi:beta-galactosidase 14 [Phtheirospermum japonicum]|uniref:Beta-galactosidase 14 n=1 Tax=Phtheirospermum japonicum TaxID=374723 RepID=A0A830C5R1_9LAMI|nr:beta-galactosidase 14 [Phtheirospermum japonicum]